MDFRNEIAEFVSGKKEGITIIEQATGKVVYADTYYEKTYGDVVGKVAAEVFDWLGDCPAVDAEGNITEWEIIEAGKYFVVHTASFEKEGNTYTLHQMTDISVYMTLNRDMTKYMSFFKKLSGFQAAVMEKLQSTYYELLPMLSDFFKSEYIHLMIQRDEQLDIINYRKATKDYDSSRIECAAAALKMNGAEDLNTAEIPEKIKEIFANETSFKRLCDGDVSGQNYALYISVDKSTDASALEEETILSVIKLSVEYSIMREQLIYNSEHDMLTGLYNKGKYLAMVEKEYPNLDTIGIFNMDVNYLKQMNDTYGHEMGDKLLIKAADSIRKVTNNKVHGYRIGGDEYLMIAENLSEEEVNTIKQRWEEELARLNTLNDGVPCIIAIGLVYAQAPYNFEECMKKADALMYEDKKAKKKPGEEIR